ncbi:hypothetical protein CP532_5789 [Ophiocordyceps camponoti-leonardi (nom. inval.)]|nr:hypothetical protein CP532_5789 [Ophiocordyceps camponoti-leonardi (nom. inval.)]
MREFMDLVHGAFYEATGWRRDNSYAALNATPDALLDFATPRGLRLTLSSLATTNFASSYQLGSVGVVDGSIAYLFSSVPLRLDLACAASLRRLLRAYRPLEPLVSTTPSSKPSSFHSSSLLYGRLYLPQSRLEALAVRRVSPALQLQFSAVSDRALRDGGTVLALAQYDVGRYSFDGIGSTDGGLLGLRGVYNFGDDELQTTQQQQEKQRSQSTERERIYGRFSTGAEIYYGTLNKSGGISIGSRFATLPSYRGTPLSATLTINPLMGNVSASYAVGAGENCSLATRMEFNVFSYESAWAVGMELWRKPFRRRSTLGDDDDYDDDDGGGGDGDHSDDDGMKMRLKLPPERSWQAKLAWKQDEDEQREHLGGVLKARLDQKLRIGLLWEGRLKSLLFSLGSGIDLGRLDRPFRTLGLEVQFSS